MKIARRLPQIWIRLEQNFRQMATLTPERDMAAALQLPRKELARHRAGMVEGLDWEKRGRLVVYTEDGVHKLHVLLGLVDAVELPSSTPQSAKVTNARIRNPRLIMAEYEGESVLVRVNPTTRDRYVPGMLVHVRQDGAGWAEASRPRKRGVDSVALR